MFILYKHWLNEQMRICPEAPIAMDVSVRLTIDEESMKIPILKRRAESYKNSVTSITYIINDKPTNYQKIIVAFNKNFENLWKQMRNGITTIDEVGDLETQTTCRIYDYLMNLDDKSELEQIIAEIKTKDYLSRMEKKAINLYNSLLKDIDKIAD